MKGAIALIVVIAMLGIAVGGCSESACEKSENSGRPSHACYLENQRDERELAESETELHRLQGVSAEDERQEERKEFREGYEEAEREAEFYGK